MISAVRPFLNCMDRYERLVDKLIRESMERGEFEQLDGAGEPIDLSENPFEDPDLRTAHRLLRNAGFAPAWIEERKDIDSLFREAKATLCRARNIYGRDGKLSESPQWNRALQDFRERVAELNRRIRIYNLKAPAVAFHQKVIDAEAVIESLSE
jgi:DnaJ homolog subfamily C member 28